jgi:hypothetical protein
MCSTSTGSTTTHQRIPSLMGVQRYTCRSGPFNSNNKPQGAMLAGHSSAQSWGPTHSNLFALSRRQCYSWGGCKGSTLTLRPGPASVTTGTGPASAKTSSDAHRGETIREHDERTSGSDPGPLNYREPTFPRHQTAYSTPNTRHIRPHKALPVFQETNGRVWPRIRPNLSTPSIRLRGTLKDTTPRVDYLSR